MKRISKPKLLSIFLILFSGTLLTAQSVTVVLPDVEIEADCAPWGKHIYHTYYDVQLQDLEEDEEYWITKKHKFHTGELATAPFQPLELDQSDLTLSGDWEFVQLGWWGEGNKYKYIGTSGTYNVEYTFEVNNSDLIIDKYKEIGIYIRKSDEQVPTLVYKKITVVELNCSITGPDPICSGVATYNLTHDSVSQPYSNVNWTLTYPGGSTNGTGKVASRNFGSSPQNGNGQITYTIDHTCGINDQIESKSFWVGKPGQRPTWPAGNPTPIQAIIDDYVYIYRDSQSDPQGETGYLWSATGSITRQTPSTASVLVVEATSTGYGHFYLYGTNTCGTSTTPWHGQVYVSGGRSGGMKASPIPADSYIEITFDEDKLDKAGLLKDDQSYDFGNNPYFRIIDKLGEVKLTQKYNGEKLTTINTSKLSPGLYTIQLVMEDKVFSINIMISR